jgi:hypothetical protein
MHARRATTVVDALVEGDRVVVVPAGGDIEPRLHRIVAPVEGRDGARPVVGRCGDGGGDSGAGESRTEVCTDGAGGDEAGNSHGRFLQRSHGVIPANGVMSPTGPPASAGWLARTGAPFCIRFRIPFRVVSPSTRSPPASREAEKVTVQIGSPSTEPCPQYGRTSRTQRRPQPSDTRRISRTRSTGVRRRGTIGARGGIA